MVLRVSQTSLSRSLVYSRKLGERQLVISAASNSLRLVAESTGMVSEAFVECECDCFDAVSIEAKLLADIVRQLPNATVCLEQNEGELRVTTETTMHAIPFRRYETLEEKQPQSESRMLLSTRDAAQFALAIRKALAVAKAKRGEPLIRLGIQKGVVQITGEHSELLSQLKVCGAVNDLASDYHLSARESMQLLALLDRSQSEIEFAEREGIATFQTIDSMVKLLRSLPRTDPAAAPVLNDGIEIAVRPLVAQLAFYKSGSVECRASKGKLQLSQGSLRTSSDCVGSISKATLRIDVTTLLRFARRAESESVRLLRSCFAVAGDTVAYVGAR